MPDETAGSVGEVASLGQGPPPFPGRDAPPPPAMPPSYPSASPGSYPPPPMSMSAAAPGAATLASWGARLGGWLIDFVIFLLVQVVIGAVLRHSSVLTVHFATHMHNGTTRHTRVDFLTYIVTGIVFIVYAAWMITARGQTVGMMAVGVQAVRDGAPSGEVSTGRSFGRAVLEQVLRFTVLVWVLDMLWPLWDRKRQTLHDKAAGTVVVRVRNTG